MLRECVLLVMVWVFGAWSLDGQGFFCRDPETGQLHPANTTWTAGSFCGKYHCKLKRKNITSFEYAPLRQINITNIKLLGENLTIVDVQKKDVFVKKEEVVKKVASVENNTREPNIIDVYLDEIQGIRLQDDKNASDKDRYLSDKEIKSLTEILHTVKKGDLDAIVEIYNLAQNIDKELDKSSKDLILHEVMSTVNSLDKQITKSNMYKKVTKHDKASYWYEPLSSGKIRVAELVRPDIVRTDINPEIPAMAIAMEVPSATIVNASSKPRTSMSTLLVPVQPPLRMRKVSDTFFNSPLSRKDFGKLPYYYPMSYFQRMSSYKHEQKKPIPGNLRTSSPVPVHSPAPVSPPLPVPNIAVTKPQSRTDETYQRGFRLPNFLSYPFANIQHYNWSYPQNLFQRKVLDSSEARTQNHKNNENTIKRRINTQDNAVLMNPDLENFQDLEVRASMINENTVTTDTKLDERQKLKERRKPDWQTDSLPEQILNEVRAHIQEKQRLFIHPLPLRKKVKLERVTKLLKMDQLTRTKRATGESRADEDPLEPAIYEVYIEKTTCNSDFTEPGYFRYGNLSQPFPECCPQRIPVR